MFSSRYVRRLVPGIGIISSPWASTQASANCDGLQPFSPAISSTFGHEVQVALEVLALETRVLAAKIVGREIVGLLESAGQEPASQRAVGDEADAEFAHRGEDFVLRVAAPERVFGLQRRDGMDGVRAADRLRRRLGQPQVAHLARATSSAIAPTVSSMGVYRIDAVLVIQVDHVHAEPLQTRIAAARTYSGLPLTP